MRALGLKKMASGRRRELEQSGNRERQNKQ